MIKMNSFLKTCKPGIPKRYLLVVAAFVWTFAGCMLLFRGLSVLKFNSAGTLIQESVSIIAGICFYKFMFSSISLKHINRNQNLEAHRPCFFSFFNLRSYLMMSMMISLGVALRLSGIVPMCYLALFYITMGTPLLISAFRFFYHSWLYNPVQ